MSSKGSAGAKSCLQAVDAAYCCYNRDEKTRADSTSGGVFTLLGSYVINELNGVVFGAAFDEKFNVRHIEVDDIADLGKLRGSKYPQSALGDIFLKTRARLNEGRSVLFTGTPCQVSGLIAFLGDKPKNLLCMDFVCHGVASPMIWRGYLDEMEDSPSITKITFKHKVKGWKKWHLMIERGAKREFTRGSMDPFMRSYLHYSNVRPSCYECRFKGLSRESDFTISDCWGAGENDKQMNDNKGLSALLLRGDEARRLFNAISGELNYKEYDPQELMSGNWTAFKPVPINMDRNDFFRDVSNYGVNHALNKYYTPTALSWISYYIKRMRGIER